MHIEFYGATSGITGSCHILRANGETVLLDCGLIQGRREEMEKNRRPFPFSPREISAVVLSHGHIDHSGRIPLLVKQGYQGPIYAQNATVDLCDILLQDSAYLQEKDAQYENKWRKRKKKPFIEPLYTVDDARDALDNLVGLRYKEKREILPGISIRYQDAGHILGSACVEVWLNENGKQRKVVFSGDLGQYDSPILNDPEVIERADHVIVESTYGNRRHRDRQSTIDEIGEIIQEATHQKGNLLIPAFAIGRSQEILYYLGKYYDQWDLDRWQVFLDSPMAIRASKVYWEYPHLYDDEATKLRKQINEMPHLRNLKLTQSPEESMGINRIKSGAIIISASGMCTGGRIIHHLKHNISRSGAHIMIVGYQANGTLGRALVDGKSIVKIHGDEYRVKANIHTVGGLSAHADVDDLIRWLGYFEKSSPQVHVVHGEPESKQEFRNKLESDLNFKASVPEPGDVLEL
ncbi:MAG: MBL fold metallo-hydrolase [Candidatus Thiodiazotropha sp. (ex Lucinoma annulata)]|nr:MBL fold metallo-hydrolase [Candidatus Thiodiazotropha sp. (ex Lucinoma borealis)]MCU7839568.1 MBL fold metallo-hydrolase [Candidatus Thiodiazotropha sp. (ex Troendleina suluensis)]MCU7855130.1 MBL fold metallo-hydrolase [Candidatus Thiodiazotropha sp. (ex Lucinoma borealis)]MCU7864700.1 MBL fold metallo-hydrolase [Candidatus Thiodiazotropha sp. (ex Lucinoma borealis)]MCU7885317.1 MBL fold metallo-hydrolase [Candidatus Thiodiazotropha sp. (ex Lucinoma annulata)]